MYFYWITVNRWQMHCYVQVQSAVWTFLAANWQICARLSCTKAISVLWCWQLAGQSLWLRLLSIRTSRATPLSGQQLFLQAVWRLLMHSEAHLCTPAPNIPYRSLDPALCHVLLTLLLQWSFGSSPEAKCILLCCHTFYYLMYEYYSSSIDFD